MPAVVLRKSRLEFRPVFFMCVAVPPTHSLPEQNCRHSKSAIQPAYGYRGPTEWLERTREGLKQQLERKLHNPRRVGSTNRAKTCEASRVLFSRQRIIHVPIWLAELGMIERVEEFDTEFQVHPFFDRGI